MSYLAIMSWNGGGRVLKYQPCADLPAAEAHIARFIARYPQAFAAPTVSAPVSRWRVVNGALTVAPDAPIIRPEQVQAECARRLALGFDYDFGDGRGVHRFATAKKDMEGWSEVTNIAQARLNTADATPIDILTETGPVSVTPLEWQNILKQAALFRQPLWLASFTLQRTVPIPINYRADVHWSAP